MEKRLSISEKFSYGLGDFGYNLTAQIVSLFLMFFFTDIFGINPATAGTILLISKLWDAFADPMMGSIVDRTRSRWGQKRPYLLFGAIPYGLTFFLLFASPDMATDMKPWYAGIAFVVFCTCQTVVNIPYGSLTVSMSNDVQERSSITSWRMTMALLGTLIAGGVAPLAVNAFGGDQQGYRTLSLITGAMATILYVITFARVKERHGSGINTGAASGAEHPEKAPRARFAANLKSVLTNWSFVNLAIATLLCITALNLLAAVVPYYFKYVLNQEDLVAAGLAALLVTAAFFMPVMNILSRRMEKKTAWIIALAVLVAVLLGVYAWGTLSLFLTLGLFMAGGFGVASLYFSPWSMVADTIEYSQWKTGIRPEGALYGFFNFVFKVGTALAGFIMGLVLDYSGYAANQAQTSQAIDGIRLLIGIIPAVLIIGGIIILSRHPMTRKRHDELINDMKSGLSPAQQGSNPAQN